MEATVPKIYLGLRLETAQTVETTADNVTWTPLVFPAGSVWHDPHDLLTEIQAAGGLLYLLDTGFGVVAPNTILAAASGTDWGVRFTSAPVIDAYLGSPGTIWQPTPSSNVNAAIFPNTVTVEHVLAGGWREQSRQSYRGGTAVLGDGTTETITQGSATDTTARLKLRIAGTKVNDYRDLMTFAYQGAPWVLHYLDIVGGIPLAAPNWATTQHLSGYIDANDDALELLPEFELYDHWSTEFNARVVEVIDG
jgi:hypothetical protein